MSARPAAHRWEVLGESSDPVPGDPYEVAALGKKLRKTAESIQKQADSIKALSSVENWKSKAATEFREAAEGAEGRLRKAFKRYDAAADALGTEVREGVCSREYASELHRAQQAADKALTEAEGADSDRQSAEKALEGDLPDKDKGRKEDDKEAAEGAVRAAKRALEGAKAVRDGAARAAAEAIEYAIDNDGLKDGFWDKFKEVVNEISNWAGQIASWLGVAALLLSWVPILGQVLAVLATVVTVVSLLSNITKLAMGEGSWADVALDVVGLATVGVGRAAALGAKAGINGTKALAHSRLFQQGVKAAAKAGARYPARAALQFANKKAPGAVLGPGKQALIDAIPKKGWPGLKNIKDGFSPAGMGKDLAGVLKGGFKADARSLGDANVVESLRGLKDLGSVGLQNPAIRSAMLNTAGQSAVWAGSTATSMAAGPGNVWGHWYDDLK
ncbi:hypothetical protein ACFW5S_04295 [Streptomyces olivaceus]|uniref:hypothetical protein n=1 Tax=Streptomyces olivaceus TaxID=47716 RepID=UPI00367E21F0